MINMKTGSSFPVSAPRRRGLAYNLRKHWQLYLFLLLPVTYILIFHYYPLLGLQLAFKKFNIRLGMWNSPWVGLKNFSKFFKSYQFGRVLPNTLIVSFYSLTVSFLVAIVFALALNSMRVKKLQKVLQNVSYIPHFISTVVLVGMLNVFFSPYNGPVAALIQLFGGEMGNVLTSNRAFDHLYVWSGVWQGTGWGAIIYIGALTTVSPELHEAAVVDGASIVRRILSIDLPSILPTIVLILILNAGSILGVGFEKVFLMQNNVNASASEVISTYVYKKGIQGGKYSYSAAVGLFNSVVNFFFVVLVNGISRRLTQSGLF